MSTSTQSYLAGLIGDGVIPSLTPPMHEAEAEAQGLRCVYRPVDLSIIGRPGADVGDLVRAGRDLGFNGFNITYPCKQLVLAHLDEIASAAAQLGAVNTVVVTGEERRLVGHNTDAAGFGGGLAEALPDADLTDVVQVGTGGAGSAVAYALLERGVQRLHLIDLDLDRAAERATAMGAIFPDRTVDAATPDALPALLAAATGVVNCTPLGMHNHPGAPFDLTLLRPQHWVADVIYRPMNTPLIEAAQALGCAVMDGGHMAVAQAVESFTLMTGRPADPDRVRATFLQLIAEGR